MKERYYGLKNTGMPYPVYVYANRKNAGDLLSAKGVQSVVGLKGQEYIIEGNDTRKFLKSFREKNVKLIIGGGGLLHKAFADFWQALVLSQMQYLLFGIGMCDIKTKNSMLPDMLLRQVISGAEHIWVRDSASAALLEDRCGRKPSTIPCPSIHYIVKKYASLAGENVKSRRQTLLYVHHRKLVHTADRSDDFVRNIARKICDDNAFLFTETDNICSDPSKLLLKYLQADFIISTRLHGCIFSYALNKPFIAISADRKIDAFVHDYCNASVFDMHELMPTRLRSAATMDALQPPRRDDFPILMQEIEKAGEFIRNLFMDKQQQKKLSL